MHAVIDHNAQSHARNHGNSHVDLPDKQAPKAEGEPRGQEIWHKTDYAEAHIFERDQNHTADQQYRIESTRQHALYITLGDIGKHHRGTGRIGVDAQIIGKKVFSALQPSPDFICGHIFNCNHNLR